MLSVDANTVAKDGTKQSPPPSVVVPTISALFLARFDLKKGTTLEWQQSRDDALSLDGVEDKAIPSGLHHVERDVVYFTHGRNYTGLSVFWNEPREAASRNAEMFAVGVLLQTRPGRLGRLWTHIEGLQGLAAQVAEQSQGQIPHILQKYWDDQNHRREPQELYQDDTSKRAEEPTIERSQMRSPLQLSPHHPALSVPSFLDTFGPLVFPLHRAALLGQRILFMTDAPVARACNYVHVLSLISTLPELSTFTSSQIGSIERQRAKYCLGIQDILDLEKHSSSGWIGCTTDRIIQLKANVWDLLVILPSSYGSASSELPELRQADNTILKATQRDLRRYHTLRSSIHEHTSNLESRDLIHALSSEDVEETAARHKSFSQQALHAVQPDSERASASAEPYAWTALAYNSYVWWASAGEAGAELDEERLSDLDLFCDTSSVASVPSSPRLRRASTGASSRHSHRRTYTDEPIEAAVLAYFRRLTTVLVEAIDQLVLNQLGASSYQDDIEDEPDSGSVVRMSTGDTGPNDEASAMPSPAQTSVIDTNRRAKAIQSIRIEGHDFTNLGLDIWNRNDHIFVQRFCQRYFATVADIRGGVIECCGLRFH